MHYIIVTIIRNLVLLVAAAGLFTSCVDLKAVNTYAESSQKSFLAENVPAYGYAAYVYDSAYIFGVGRFLKYYDADSAQAIGFDTIIAKEYSLLAAYFNALAKLSGSSETIHADTLTGALAAGTYGSFTITTTEAGVATELGVAAKFLLTAGIRDKDIKNNLSKNWPAVKGLLDTLALHHSNLQLKIANLQSNLELRSDTLARSASTAAERWSVVYDYKEKIRELSAVIHKYEIKRTMIANILKGYQKLLDDDSHWKSKDLKDKIGRLVAEINYLSNSSKN
jgi:hypothetical protein